MREILLRQAGSQPELSHSPPKLELDTCSHPRTVPFVHSFVHTLIRTFVSLQGHGHAYSQGKIMKKHARMLCLERSNLVALGLVVVGGLSACGGGGSSAATPSPAPVAATPSTPASTPSTGGTPSTSDCPMTNAADAWINNRLGCLKVGQPFIDLASSATGTRSDIAFVIRQLNLDASFNNVLSNNAARYFRHFVCVRNAPAGLTDGLNRLSLATDLSVSIGTSNGSQRKPPQIGAVTLEVAGGNGPGWTAMTCDPAVHPVIVDFDSKLIQSLNPVALAALQVFDL